MQSEMFCSLEDVARAYGVSVPTVRYWCRRGAIDGAIHAGREWRIPRKYSTGTVEIVIPKKAKESK